MKGEDIYNGITDIRDDLIEKAGRKKNKKRVWRGAVAAVLAVALLAGGFAVWRYSAKDPGTDDPSGVIKPGPGNAVTLAAAEYPQMVQRPDSYRVDDYDLWQEDQRAHELSAGEAKRLSGYFKAVTPVFLAASDDKNSVCSPVNVYMALSMLCEITDGSTRGQIMELLGAESIEEVRERASKLWNGIYNDDGTSKLLLANSLWLRDDMSYNEDTITRLKEDYYASSFAGEMGGAALDQLLQDWLNGQTGGLLGDQIGEIGLDPETAIALASTVYFSDKWDYRFFADETTSEIFHAPDGDVNRDFMHKTVDGKYLWGDSYTGTFMYFGTAGTMRLLLPDEGVSIEDILNDQKAVAVLTGTSTGNSEDVMIDLSLPKFDVVSDTDLKSALGALGVTEVFDKTSADFTPLTHDTDEIYVSKILHGARVLIDEEGCEAGAYTVHGLMTGWPPEDKVELIFDRPFLFSIIVEGVPMFVGIVNQP